VCRRTHRVRLRRVKNLCHRASVKCGLRRLALLTLPLLLAAGALGTTPAHAAPATKPKVGDCHDLTWKTSYGMSDTRRPVSCRSRHTLQTVGVPTLHVALAGLSDDDLNALAIETCEPVWVKAMGRGVVERSVTAYKEYLFVPTARQIADGARWVRCDIALLAGKFLLQLPRHRLSRPILSKRQDDTTLRCLTGKHLPTPCAQHHAYRPLDVVRFKPLAYPTTSDFEDAGSELCPAATAYFTWVSQARWRIGDRALVCYAKSSK
jgi:hypothetical protein